MSRLLQHRPLRDGLQCANAGKEMGADAFVKWAIALYSLISRDLPAHPVFF